MKQIVTVGVAVMALVGISLAQDRSQTRSMVMAQAGIVASESVLASQVGARILESGGNAIDAAVATNAVMGLVAPMNDGIGGDLFVLVYEAKTGLTHPGGRRERSRRTISLVRASPRCRKPASTR
jgi:gamma-glutamyltranspeptidase/glutathione hydrolase